jgi:hypothetical protein
MNMRFCNPQTWRHGVIRAYRGLKEFLLQSTCRQNGCGQNVSHIGEVNWRKVRNLFRSVIRNR